MSKTATKATAASSNPFQTTWRTPHGLPPFAKISPEHYWPAFKQALAEHKAEIAAIGANEKKPSFQNTIVALEKSGDALNKVADVFFNLSSSDTSPALQEIERKLAPVLAQHSNTIQLDQKLFRRIEDLYERREKLKLDDEQARLLERTYTTFVRAGARLCSEGAQAGRGNQHAACRAGHRFRAERAGGRAVVAAGAGGRGRSRGTAAGRARCGGADGGGSEIAGEPCDHAVAVERGAVPAILSPARSARGSVQGVDPARGERRQDGQPQDRRRDREAARGTGEADGLSHVRRIQPRRHDGEDAGCGARASQSGVVGGGGARRRGARGADGAGAQGGRQLRPRGVGLAVSRGEGAQGALRSR